MHEYNLLFFSPLSDQGLTYDLRILVLSVVAHPIFAIASLLALVPAAPAVPWVEQNVNAAPSAANFTVPALFSTPPAVLCVGCHVHTLLPAAVRTRLPADPRKDIACHWSSLVVVLSQLGFGLVSFFLWSGKARAVAEAMISNVKRIFAMITNCLLKYYCPQETRELYRLTMKNVQKFAWVFIKSFT